MKLFKNPSKNLDLILGGKKITLYPGDNLVLEQEAYAECNSHRKVKASVSVKYNWDGYTLKEMC